MKRFKKKHFYSFDFGIITWVYIGIALILGFVVPQINQWFFSQWESPINTATLATILASIASGMITLSGLVFSLVFVMVQFGSSTYSPRITRVFAHAYVLRHSLGIFTGTFLYSLMALRMIGMEQTEKASFFTVWIAFIWLLASVGILARLIRVFTTMTITNILAALGKIGLQSISRVYTCTFSVENKSSNAIETFFIKKNSGKTIQKIVYKGEVKYVNGYDRLSLVSLAYKTKTVIYLPYAIGDSLKDAAPIALILGNSPFIHDSELYELILLERERMFVNDPKFVFRLLVDTAIRALSPAINDPTTAVQTLDHIETLLRRLANAYLG